MSTRSIVAYERKSGKIVSSYVHYDGYVTGVGMELLDKHNSESSATSLANHGSFSSLGKGERRSDTDLFASVNALSNYLEEKTENGGSVHDLEFAYLWKNGEWYVADLCGEHRRNYRHLRETDLEAYYDSFFKSVHWETLDTAFVRHAEENISSLRKRLEKAIGTSDESDFREYIEYLEGKRDEIRERTISELAREITS